MGVRKGLMVMLALLVSGGVHAAELEVSDAYVRATPPGMTITAAFFRISNTSNEEVSLKAVAVAGASKAEIHEHKNEGGMMQMREVESLDIPAKGSAVLEPGGYHVMIFGLTEPLRPGAAIDMTLTFDNGESIELHPEVRKIAIQ